MTAIRSLIMFSAFMVMSALPVQAQNIPQFSPSGAWNVEKTEFAKVRGLNGVQLPCMMAMTFDNGYVMRLSGGGNKMLAMAIDFRQNVFHQGRQYPAQLDLNQSGFRDITATAFSESTLIFNMRGFEGFYQNLQNGSPLALNIDGNQMIFSMGNAQDSLSALESCYGVAPVEAPSSTQTAEAPADNTSTPNISRPVNPPSQEWRANAGDDLQMTLQNWASRAGVQIAWQADHGGKVVSDLVVNGTFNDAVQQLMAQNSAALGIEANMMGSLPTQGTSISRATDSGPQNITPQVRPSAQSKWNAPAGASLQIVLQNWSQAAGVEFIWQSNEDFRVKAPVNMGNSYEEALQNLLGQFQNDRVRPAAQYNTDPETGRRTLIVQSSRVL